MTDQIETAAEVIKRLIAALCDQPNEVEVYASETADGVAWSFSTDTNDMAKVMGQRGAHLRALQLIVEQMGMAVEFTEEWTLNPLVGTGTERPRRGDIDRPEAHDPSQDMKLLNEILAALAVAAYVRAPGSPESGFLFAVEPSSRQDEATLRQPHEAVYPKTHPMEREPLQLIGALATVWRSIGRKQGVRYRLGFAEKSAPAL